MRIIFIICILLFNNTYGQKSIENNDSNTDSILNVVTKKNIDLTNQIKEQSQDLSKAKNELSQIKKDLSKIETKDNSDLTISIISLLIAIISVVVAFGLLKITRINNENNNRILEKQIDQQREMNDEQRRIQRALQRPVVDAYRSGWEEKTELVMINYGLGPAILESITFEKEGHPSTTTIADLIDIKKIDKDIWWDNKWSYNEKDYYLYPQQKTKLYKITKERLMKKYGKSVSEAENIIQAVRDAREGITFNVKYVDIISKENPENRNEYITSIPLYNKKTSG